MPLQTHPTSPFTGSRRQADKWLLTTGILLVVAAAAGGGVKLAGGELSPINSLARQLILAAIGIAVIAASFLVDLGRIEAGGAGDEGGPATAAERAEDDTRRAPVLGEESRAFAAARTFAAKKERFLLPLETEIRTGRRRLSRSELDDCSQSEWDLDRVAFYLTADYSNRPALSELLFYIEQERERIVASAAARSMIPLHYAVRAFRHRITLDTDAAADLRAETKERFGQMLDYLMRNSQLDAGGQVKKNLRRALELLEEREHSPTLVPLVFDVSVPESTDATGKSVCIAGTLDRLAGGRPQWNPGGVVLGRVDARRWTIELLGEPGTELEYKYTLGDWTWVEKTTHCDEMDDRKLTITPDARGTHVQSDVVANWRNVAPCAD